MIVVLIVANIIFTLILIALAFLLRPPIGIAISRALEPLVGGIDAVRRSLEDKFTTATADMAKRLADTKGDLRQEITDRLEAAFKLMRDSVDQQMLVGRTEQSRALEQTVLRLETKFTELQRATEQRFDGFGDRQSQSLAQSRNELIDSLARNLGVQKQELTTLANQTRDGFEAFRYLVEQKLESLGDRQALALRYARKEVSDTLSQSLTAQKQELTTLENQTRDGFEAFRKLVENKLEGLGDRQAQALAEARKETSDSLAQNGVALKQEVMAFANQTRDGLSAFRQTVEQKLEGFADRQGQALAGSRKEMSDSLAQNGNALRQELTALNQETAQRLEAIRNEVDQKLLAISDQVQLKLDQNIKEGFKQFEKVQEHLRAAEEQLRNVNTIGASINDLNNLLKLPHLRGRFGEASLERLLEDFLPAQMYELQAAAGEDGKGRADAVIKFPDRTLPIDAKFPREQVLSLFDSSDPAKLAIARIELVRVLKEEAKRITGYINPENGTTDMALMYLPSETLYMEAILNGELSEWLNKLRVFPVSPNTLIVMLQSIQMVFKMYEFAKNFEKATEELGKAQRTFGLFERKFDEIGRTLDKTQTAYGTAKRHLGTYRRRVTDLTGEQVPELDAPAELEEEQI